jgi:hypothetical protein
MMGPPDGRNHKGINFGDVLHLMEVGMLLASMGAAYAEFQQTAKQVEVHTQQLNRIEHYLSSRDPEYWQRTKEE